MWRRFARDGAGWMTESLEQAELLSSALQTHGAGPPESTCSTPCRSFNSAVVSVTVTASPPVLSCANLGSTRVSTPVAGRNVRSLGVVTSLRWLCFQGWLKIQHPAQGCFHAATAGIRDGTTDQNATGLLLKRQTANCHSNLHSCLAPDLK